MAATPAVVSTPVPAPASTPTPAATAVNPTPSPTLETAGQPPPSGETPTATFAAPASTPTAEPAPTATPEPTPEVVLVSRSSMTRDTAPVAGDADLAELVAGNNAFAFDLYQALAEDGDNLFYSPHSISLALAMAYGGARGDTERQMAETLRFTLPQDRLHPAFNSLDLSLVPENGDVDPSFRLSIANSVWGQRDYGFLPGYIDALAVNYGEEVRPVDFRNDREAARVSINDWVAVETEDRITDLIPPDALTELTRLVLANAIYFKAEWQHTFDERATSEQPFYLLDGSERRVPMMRQLEDLRYARGDGYQAVELPYQGGEVAMTIIVPDSGRFQEFQDSLDGDKVGAIIDSLEYESVRLALPKFEVESAFNLSETLKNMGMPDAFDDEAANFSGMDGRLCRTRGGYLPAYFRRAAQGLC